MWDPEANILYPHTVLLREPGVVNDYGRKRDNGPPTVTRKAYVEYKMRLVRDIKGQQTMSSTTVYLNGSDGPLELTSEWSCTLPSGESRPILMVDRYSDEDGDEFEVLHLQ